MNIQTKDLCVMLELVIDPFHIIVKKMVPGTTVGSTDSGQTVLITLKVTVKRVTPPGFKFWLFHLSIVEV